MSSTTTENPTQLTSAIKNIQGTIIFRGLTLFFSLFTAFFYGRILEPTELAMLAFVGILASLEEMITGFGTASFLLKNYQKAIANNKLLLSLSYIKSFLIVSVFSSLIFALGVAFFAEYLFTVFFKFEATNVIFYLLILIVFFMALYRSLSFVAQAQGRFILVNALSSVNEISRTLASIGFYFLFGPVGLLSGILLVQTILLTLLFFNFRNTIFAPSKCYPISSLLKESGAYYLEGYVRFISQRSDTFLVSMMFDPISLAYYFMARNLAGKLAIFRDSVTNVLAPYMSRASSKGVKNLELVMNKSVNALSCAIVPPGIFLGVSSFWILNIFSGDKYLISTASVAIICVYLIFFSFQAVLVQALFVHGGQTERLQVLIVQSIGMLVSLYVLYRLWPNFNIIAISRLLGLIPAFFFALYLLSKHGKFTIDLSLLKTITTSCLLGAVVVIFFQYFFYNIFITPIILMLSLTISLFVFLNISNEHAIKKLFTGATPMIIRIINFSYKKFRLR